MFVKKVLLKCGEFMKIRVLLNLLIIKHSIHIIITKNDS